MKSKSILLIATVLISLVGLSGGFFLTKLLALNSDTRISFLTIVDYNTQTAQAASDAIQNEALLKTQKEALEAQKALEAKKEESKKKYALNTCPKPDKEYEDKMYLDVGQTISLGDTAYTPYDLVEINTNLSKSRLCLKDEANTQLALLIANAKKDDRIIVVTSGFRDFDTQKNILNSNIKNGNKNAYLTIAKPGYSEHQLGVAVDLTSPSIHNKSATSAFGNTKESDWLEEHAYEYGFIQSYPKGKQDSTGYIYEPWHYRYVGIKDAMEIVKNGKAVNEYLKDKKL